MVILRSSAIVVRFRLRFYKLTFIDFHAVMTKQSFVIAARAESKQDSQIRHRPRRWLLFVAPVIYHNTRFATGFASFTHLHCRMTLASEIVLTSSWCGAIRCRNMAITAPAFIDEPMPQFLNMAWLWTDDCFYHWKHKCHRHCGDTSFAGNSADMRSFSSIHRRQYSFHDYQ